MAAAASSIEAANDGFAMSRSSAKRVALIGGASPRFITANAPTATKASSFTSDSNAIASITPSWCSVASSWRVPNRAANRAISSATPNAGSAYQAGCEALAPVSTSMLVPTALYCRAR